MMEFVASFEPSSTMIHSTGFMVWFRTDSIVPRTNCSSSRTGVMMQYLAVGEDPIEGPDPLFRAELILGFCESSALIGAILDILHGRGAGKASCVPCVQTLCSDRVTTLRGAVQETSLEN